MKKFGWQNVRGYSWTEYNLKLPPKYLNNFILYKKNGVK